MKVAGTGHRPDKLNKEWNGEGPLSTLIIRDVETLIIEWKPDEIISGMALGFDTLLAKVALRLGVDLTCAIPFKGQELFWPEASQTVYHSILRRAKKVVYVSPPPYSTRIMSIRNEWMVNQLTAPEDKLLALHDGTKGGTFNCLQYAERRIGKAKIHTLDPNDFRKTLKQLVDEHTRKNTTG